MISDDKIIQEGYICALKFANSHYENFPVVSFLIPNKIKKHIAVIYWFARTADDFADEGNLLPETRLENLTRFEANFKNLLKGEANSALEAALLNTINEKKLPHQLFYDLLTAFKLDVVKNRFNDFNEILQYCKFSANPIGRLLLHLYEVDNCKAFEYSDSVCTALQLINFYQDLSIDLKKNRLYFSLEELNELGLSEKIFEIKQNNFNLKKLLLKNIKRAEQLLENGKNLLPYLKGFFKYEIKWTILCGELILNKIEELETDIFTVRPKLSKADFVLSFIKTFLV